jgi:hypothetical protein
VRADDAMNAAPGNGRQSKQSGAYSPPITAGVVTGMSR